MQPVHRQGPIIYGEDGQPLGGLELSSLEGQSINSISSNNPRWWSHDGGSLRPLEQIHEKWITVDSGASVAVVPKNCASDYKITPTRESAAGVCYTVANGNSMPDLGQRSPNIVTENGILKKVRFHVADVDKPLLAVSAVRRKGYRVVFDDESYIQNKINPEEKIPLIEENGTYKMKAWLVPPSLSEMADSPSLAPAEVAGQDSNPVFHRQGLSP